MSGTLVVFREACKAMQFDACQSTRTMHIERSEFFDKNLGVNLLLKGITSALWVVES